MKSLYSICLALLFVTLASGFVKASDDTVPVKVTIRKALNSNTALVAQFTSSADKDLAVKAVFARAKGDATKTFHFTLKAGGWKEIGRTQGWTPHSGDKIIVSSAGFSDLHCHLP